MRRRSHSPSSTRREHGRVVQVERRPGPFGRDPSAGGREPAQLPVQVRPDRDRAGELALQHRVVPGPRPLDGQRPVEAGVVGRLQLVAQRRDVLRNVSRLLPREVERHRHERQRTERGSAHHPAARTAPRRRRGRVVGGSTGTTPASADPSALPDGPWARRPHPPTAGRHAYTWMPHSILVGAGPAAGAGVLAGLDAARVHGAQPIEPYPSNSSGLTSTPCSATYASTSSWVHAGDAGSA